VHYQDIPTQQQTVMVVNQIDNNNYQRTHKYAVYYQDIPAQQQTVMIVNQIDNNNYQRTHKYTVYCTLYICEFVDNCCCLSD
jgi:hypothetical protein